MTPFELDAIKDRVLEARANPTDATWQLTVDAMALVLEVERLRRVGLHVANVVGDTYDRDAGLLIRERVGT